MKSYIYICEVYISIHQTNIQPEGEASGLASVERPRDGQDACRGVDGKGRTCIAWGEGVDSFFNMCHFFKYFCRKIMSIYLYNVFFMDFHLKT